MSQNTFWHNEIRGSCSCYDILFCNNITAVVRSRQLHEYKRNKSGDYLTFHTPQRADC